MSNIKDLQHLGKPVKIIKKPVIVLTKLAKEAGQIMTGWNQLLQYNAGDYIISDQSGDQWPVQSEIYKQTYIDGETIDELLLKWEKDPFICKDELFKIEHQHIVVLKKYFKDNLLINKKYDDELYGVKKLVFSDAIIANGNGTLKTLEGETKYEKNDFIVIGVAGETWPINKQKIDKEYLFGENTQELFGNWIKSI